MTKIIDGTKIAENLRKKVHSKVKLLKKQYNFVPGLAVIIVGNDPASKVYVKNKIVFTKEVGMNSYEYKLDEEISQKKLVDLIQTLNDDPEIHGILCQLPLPKHINESEIINVISHKKDVDGFNIKNVGLLNTNQLSLVPCTPQGCIILLKSYLKNLEGKKATIIGRSNIVGKPLVSLLLKENCTVTIAHSKTKKLDKIKKNSDILIAAVGKAKYIKDYHIKRGSIIIDVGINRVNFSENGTTKTKLVGDVDYDNVIKKAGAITPVPGGVGPMTIACLLNNTFIACCRIHNLNEEVHFNT